MASSLRELLEHARQLTMPSHLELDFSRMIRAAFGRCHTEIRWQIPHEISDTCDEERQEIGAEDLKEELEGRIALPDDLLIFLERNRDLGAR